MLRDDLLTLVSQRLGNRDDLIPRMETEVQLLQATTLERNSWLPWFLTALDTTQVTVPGDAEIPLPTDFLAEHEDQTFWIVTTSQVPLKKMDYDDMVARYPGEGTPRAYAQVGSSYFLGPIPTEAFSLVVRYFAKDEVLSTDVENLWTEFAPDVVAAELGLRMAKTHMQHMELAQALQSDVADAWKRLYTVHVAYEEASRRRNMEM